MIEVEVTATQNFKSMLSGQTWSRFLQHANSLNRRLILRRYRPPANFSADCFRSSDSPSLTDQIRSVFQHCSSARGSENIATKIPVLAIITARADECCIREHLL